LMDALAHDQPLTGSLHEGFKLDDPRAKALAQKMDGTRRIEELADAADISKLQGFLMFLDRLGGLEANLEN
jgi:hypothetical protein